MKPKEILQAASAELDCLRRRLIACDCSVAESLVTVESTAEKLATLGEDLPSRRAENLGQTLAVLKIKAKNVHTLIEAVIGFHSTSIFGQVEVADTYSPDGTLNQKQDSRIVFEG